jgi:beta-lactamase class A
MTKLMEMLYRGEALPEKSTREALDILSRQQYREKIPLLLPPKTRVCHKTGEITGVRHDCAIVMHEGAPYVLCVLTEMLPDVITADRVIAGLSLEFYRQAESSAAIR